MQLKCISKIAKGKKGIPALIYRGRKQEYGIKREIIVDFWFCWDDIQRCVEGTKRKWVIDWPQVPDIWPILSGTNLNREETLLLQHAGFQLQERPSLSPEELFNMSKKFILSFLTNHVHQIQTLILQYEIVEPLEVFQMPQLYSNKINGRMLEMLEGKF